MKTKWSKTNIRPIPKTGMKHQQMTSKIVHDFDQTQQMTIYTVNTHKTRAVMSNAKNGASDESP